MGEWINAAPVGLERMETAGWFDNFETHRQMRDGLRFFQG